jgi:HlyD family secretion protein
VRAATQAKRPDRLPKVDDKMKAIDALRLLGTSLRAHAGRIALLIGGALVAGAAVWYFVLDPPVGVLTVIRSDLVQSVVASGQVITPARASIAAEVTGRVTRVPVGEGEAVREGQLLIELDQSDELAALAQARAALSQADAKVHQLEHGMLPIAEQVLRQAQASLIQTERAYQRTSDLVASGFVSAAQLDDGRSRCRRGGKRKLLWRSHRQSLRRRRSVHLLRAF